MQTQGDFGGNSAVRKVAKSKNRRLLIKMGEFKAITPDMDDAIRNSLLRVVDTISGCVGNENDFGNLKEIGKTVSYRGRF